MTIRGKIITKKRPLIYNLSPKAKKYLAISGIILFLIGLVVINKLLPKPSTHTSDQGTTIPSVFPKITARPTPELEVPKSDTVEVSGVKVDNFYTDAKVVNAQGDLSLGVEGKDYSIVYFPQNQMFNISILRSPFAEKRKMAEEAFVEKMGVDKTALCSINVIITTPYFANPEEAGKIYSLSFCE